MLVRMHYRLSHYLHVPVGSSYRRIIFAEGSSTVELVPPKPISHNVRHRHSDRGNKLRPLMLDAPCRVVCTIEIDNSREGYERATKLAFSKIMPFIEWLRVKSAQPQLSLFSEYDLEFERVTTPEGRAMQQWQKEFRKWSRNPHERDNPLITSQAWDEAETATRTGRIAALHWMLLLDAESELESNPRNAILYADMACEVFIQGYTAMRAEETGIDDRFWKWLVSAPYPEGRRPSTLNYFDSVLALVDKKSLKQDARALSDELRDLVNARNRVAHDGEVPLNVVPAKLVRAARRAIEWVEGPTDFSSTRGRDKS